MKNQIVTLIFSATLLMANPAFGMDQENEKDSKSLLPSSIQIQTPSKQESLEKELNKLNPLGVTLTKMPDPCLEPSNGPVRLQLNRRGEIVVSDHQYVTQEELEQIKNEGT